MALRKEKKEKTRRLLIDTALRLSAEKGLSTLSIRELTREAGVAPTSFYRHFTDMDDLGLVLLDEVGVSLRRLMREARRSRSGTEAGSVSRPSIEAFMEYLRENGNLFRLLLGERSGSTPAFRKALHAEINRFVGELTEGLFYANQIYRNKLERPELAAEAIVAVVFTLGAEALELPSHRRKELTDRLVSMVQIILRGARVPKGTGRFEDSYESIRPETPQKVHGEDFSPVSRS